MEEILAALEKVIVEELIGSFYKRRGAVTVVDTGSGKAEVVKPVSSGDAFIFVSAEYISVFITFVINITIDRRCRDHLLPTPSLFFAYAGPHQTTLPRDQFFI